MPDVATSQKMYMSSEEPSKFLRIRIGEHRNPNIEKDWAYLKIFA